MDGETLALLEFVKHSKNRLKIIKALDGNVLIPSQIAKITGIQLNNVSRNLRELREKNLIVLLNPETSFGRLYRLDEKGVKILENIKKGEEV